jgi:hypothetical protein
MSASAEWSAANVRFLGQEMALRYRLAPTDEAINHYAEILPDICAGGTRLYLALPESLPEERVREHYRRLYAIDKSAERAVLIAKRLKREYLPYNSSPCEIYEFEDHNELRLVPPVDLARLKVARVLLQGTALLGAIYRHDPTTIKKLSPTKLLHDAALTPTQLFESTYGNLLEFDDEPDSPTYHVCRTLEIGLRAWHVVGEIFPPGQKKHLGERVQTLRQRADDRRARAQAAARQRQEAEDKKIAESRRRELEVAQALQADQRRLNSLVETLHYRVRRDLATLEDFDQRAVSITLAQDNLFWSTTVSVERKQGRPWKLVATPFQRRASGGHFHSGLSLVVDDGKCKPREMTDLDESIEFVTAAIARQLSLSR